MVPSTFLLKIIATAQKGGCEVTLTALCQALEATGLTLDRLEVAKEFLAKGLFDLVPPVSTGDFDTPRILKLRTPDPISADTALAEIRHVESSQLEFKSSLYYDYNRARSGVALTPQQLKSDDVLYSTLKTIAAFMNSGGGLLYVGVDDQLSPIGLINDCVLLGQPVFDADTWELELRNHLTGKFKNCTNVNDYVSVKCIQIGALHVARIQVLNRTRLTFITRGGITRLYRRQGNRTVEVAIDEVEEFLQYRAGQQVAN